MNPARPHTPSGPPLSEPLPQVTVFTMTYNQRAKALLLMRDLAVQSYPPQRFELVVLDDGGTDGTTEAVQELAAEVPYSVTIRRRTHEADYLNAKRWNECIAAASPDTSVFIQVDDVRVRPDFIAQHVKWHLEPNHNLVAGAKFEGDSETWDLASCRRAHLAGEDGQASAITAWTAAWGASLSYTRGLVQTVWEDPYDRPFDERMVGWGFHEVELAGRMAGAGATVIYDPAAGVFHQNHTPQNDRGRGIDHTRQVEAASARNEQYVREKHGLARLPRW